MWLRVVVLLICVALYHCLWFSLNQRCCNEVGGTCFEKMRGLKLPQCFLPDLLLYTREVKKRGNGDEKYSGVPITSTHVPEELNATRPTVFIVHGWKDGPEETEYSWMYQLRDALILYSDMNVILVDWSSHSKTSLTNYGQAAGDTRVVGKAIHDVLMTLEELGLNISLSHCIGHSLGSHICGFAGKYRGFGRITGLDPAGPGFEMASKENRLSQDDAMFVDVIHTDGGGFTFLDYGTLVPMGHVDFYPNGGRHQRGCKMNKRSLNSAEGFPVVMSSRRQKKSLAENTKTFEEDVKRAAFTLVGCSHMRAISLYISSITHTCLQATAMCATARKKYLGFCIRMKDETTYPVLGYHTDWSVRGLYHLTTGPEPPFCENPRSPFQEQPRLTREHTKETQHYNRPIFVN